jgi:hypothetical protein
MHSKGGAVNALLISIIWLQGSPVLHTQPLVSEKQCASVAEATIQMIQGQALTNMTGGNNQLKIVHDERLNLWTLSTGLVGREVARLQCVPT